MAATPPGYTYRQIPRNYTVQTDMASRSKGLIQHVAVGGNFSLLGWFSNPSAQASSHFWCGFNDGQREMYLDPDRHRSWAQAGGNPDYHSIETAGNPEQPLTAAQIEAEADLYAWGHTRYGWPFKLAEHPGEPGFGWHGMGGSAWGGHVFCPGPLRKAQRSDVLRLAEKIISGTVPGPAPAPEPEKGILDMSEYNQWTGIKTRTKENTWTTLDLSGKGAYSCAIEPGQCLVTVEVAARLPEGAGLQARIYEVDFEKGSKTRRVGNMRPQLELVRTPGQTFGTAVLNKRVASGPGKKSRRVRAEVKVTGASGVDVVANVRATTEK